MTIIEATEIYQCPGCVLGCDTKCDSYIKETIGSGCHNHVPGTITISGTIFLGMPKGFNKVGPWNNLKISIFDTMIEAAFYYDNYNIPVWKYKNHHNHIFIKGVSPRINKPFLHIILNGDIKSINCLEITDEMLSNMD